jgi:hypothetical protein
VPWWVKWALKAALRWLLKELAEELEEGIRIRIGGVVVLIKLEKEADKHTNKTYVLLL